MSRKLVLSHFFYKHILLSCHCKCNILMQLNEVYQKWCEYLSITIELLMKVWRLEHAKGFIHDCFFLSLLSLVLGNCCNSAHLIAWT